MRAEILAKEKIMPSIKDKITIDWNEVQERVREIEQMTDDQLQELYSGFGTMHGGWNANHDVHDWGGARLTGMNVSIARCIRCGKPKYNSGETSPNCVDKE